MDSDTSLPGTPTGGPLQAATPERVNQLQSSHGRDSSVYEKINQFNSMSVGAVSKQLERKTADAALKRAMLGREEAELEMRRYRDETKSLRRAIEEGKERERRVGERLETVMEHYGRAKETHAHTQALWEKEIRRARKETFKTQSSIVKSQEELKAARAAAKTLEESLEREKERSRVREQEAFTARYQIVGVQEQLEQALARVMVVEQERDAYKTAAKNEEVARIAAEGRLPLPRAADPEDEFASPPKKGMKKRKVSSDGVAMASSSRVSLSTMEIASSVATEMEIEELTLQVQWERQRAERAQEMVEFLQAECEMHCCPCSKSKSRASLGSSQRRRQRTPPVEVLEPVHDENIVTDDQANLETGLELELEVEEVDEVEEVVLAQQSQVEVPEPEPQHESEPEHEQPDELEPRPELEAEPEPAQEQDQDLQVIRSKKGPRLSTIFCPKEGVFRTVSEQEAEEFEAQQEAERALEADVPVATLEEHDAEVEVEEKASMELETEPMHVDTDVEPDEHAVDDDEFTEPPTPQANPRMYARTPSVDPPAFAMLGQGRTSLLSLLNAPHSGDAHIAPTPRIPMVPDENQQPTAVEGDEADDRQEDDDAIESRTYDEEVVVETRTYEEEETQLRYEEEQDSPVEDIEKHEESEEMPEPNHSPEPLRPNSSTASYTVTTTVPLKEETNNRSTSSTLSSSSFSEKLRTPSSGSFDLTNPALTPTMTREQALAKIRERRGRAKSAAQQGGASAQKKIVQGVVSRRDMSAPTAKTGAGRMR